MVYMLGLLPFFLRILMEVRVTTRKTARATARPTRRERSELSTAWEAGKKRINVSWTYVHKKLSRV